LYSNRIYCFFEVVTVTLIPTSDAQKYLAEGEK
jgi:hypothetical protein